MNTSLNTLPGQGIRIDQLRKRYGSGDTAVDALKNVNMTVAPGEVVGLSRAGQRSGLRWVRR